MYRCGWRNKPHPAVSCHPDSPKQGDWKLLGQKEDAKCHVLQLQGRLDRKAEQDLCGLSPLRQLSVWLKGWLSASLVLRSGDVRDVWSPGPSVSLCRSQRDGPHGVHPGSLTHIRAPCPPGRRIQEFPSQPSAAVALRPVLQMLLFLPCLSKAIKLGQMVASGRKSSLWSHLALAVEYSQAPHLSPLPPSPSPRSSPSLSSSPSSS